MTIKDRPTLHVNIAGRKLEFHPVDESPCRRACPAGIDVKRYVGQIASGDFAGALATIRRHMPFPSACGRICLHPCENECTRGKIDEPIAIMHLKRFVADYESRKGAAEPLPAIAPKSGKKIAIIGSGPAGLTAAHDLAIKGHEITVFERMSEPGGCLIHAIPEFELPSSAVRRDIERIESLGVKIICGYAIHGEAGLEALLDEGYSAVLLATGAHARWHGFTGQSWIPGGYIPGVIGAVDFMKKYRTAPKGDVSRSLGKTVVLGLGVHALGCARTAIRLGCPEVHWIIPIAKKHLQPDSRLVKQAEEEGVDIIELKRPAAIENSSGKVGGVRVSDLMISDIDHTGRLEYWEVPESVEVIHCDTVIDAAHFVPDIVWEKLSVGPWGTIKVDPDMLRTALPGIFAAGDVVSGPKSIVEAVAMGHRAAEGIDRFLRGTNDEIRTLSTAIDISGWEIENPAELPSRVFRPSARNIDERVRDFKEVEESFTLWEAEHEARRCLLCGPCEECAVCLSTCYRKRGLAQVESEKAEFIRVPAAIARGLVDKSIGEGAMQLFTAVVDNELCRGCGVCEDVCGYHAPRLAPGPKCGFVSHIDVLACKGCGTCIAACPSSAIDQGVTSLLSIREKLWGGSK